MYSMSWSPHQPQNSQKTLVMRSESMTLKAHAIQVTKQHWQSQRLFPGYNGYVFSLRIPFDLVS